MTISKVYCLKEDSKKQFCFGSLTLALEEGAKIVNHELTEDDLEKKALLSFNDGDIICVCNIENALKEYDARKYSIQDESILSLDEKKCPICGNDGDIYFEVGENMYHVCRDHVLWLLEQDNWM